MKKPWYDLSKGYPSREEQLATLARMTDDDIDFSDIPEVTDWSGAIRGREAWLAYLENFRPLKKQVTLRLDADILAWFKANSPKYQTAMNAALREYIAQHSKQFRALCVAA